MTERDNRTEGDAIKPNLQITNSKHCGTTGGFEAWHFGFGNCLEFGIWISQSLSHNNCARSFSA